MCTADLMDSKSDFRSVFCDRFPIGENMDLFFNIFKVLINKKGW